MHSVRILLVQLLEQGHLYQGRRLMMEAPPCRKCGSTKTGSASHGFLYNLARFFGYRLRMCGGCRRLRLVSRSHEPEPEVIRSAPLKMPTSTSSGNSPACPYCGSDDFRRSRRRWFDYLLRRPKMERCRQCRRRFRSSHTSHAKNIAKMQRSA